METVRAQTEKFERHLQPTPGIIEKQEQTRPENKIKQRIEQVEKTIKQSAEEVPEIPELTAELPPVVVLQEVEAAAERNLPIEGKLEKSHEIKDESAASQTFGATQVGRVLADLHQQTTAAHAAYGAAFQKEQLHSVASKASPVSYKQATLSGFWAGLFIALILIVMATVR
jgi:hypothetical protein